MKKIDGQILKNLRENGGYSIRQLADMLYVSKTTVQRWETEGLPDDEETLLNLANIFDISVEELRSPKQTERQNAEKYRRRKMKVEQYVEAKYGLKYLLILLVAAPLLILLISNLL